MIKTKKTEESKSMQIKARVAAYGLFYISVFALAVFVGITTGFRGDSHNAPGPFLLEVFVLPVGLIFWLIDHLMHHTTRVHKIGFLINAPVMIYAVVLALA